MRFDLSDEEWALLEPLLSKSRKSARVDDRNIINAIFYVLWTGMPWRDLPARYGRSKQRPVFRVNWHVFRSGGSASSEPRWWGLYGGTQLTRQDGRVASSSCGSRISRYARKRMLPAARQVYREQKARALRVARRLGAGRPWGDLITQETDRSRHRPAVAGRLDEAARGGETIDVAVPLQVVLSLEGVECQVTHPE